MIFNFNGIVLGVAAFLAIGIFHPIVILSEYHFGARCWWAFAVMGVLLAVLSMLVAHTILSASLGVVAFSCFWSIHELFEQEKRVKKGWFPENPNKKHRS